LQRIILIRHGETDWNRENRIQGGLNIPLNARGKEEVRVIALKLVHITIHYIYSSKLSRAYATAVEIAKFHKIKILTDDRLNELRQGKWEGMRVTEVRRLYPDMYSRWESNPTLVTPPGGESINEAFKRVKEFWRESILTKEGTGVIVAHKIINALIKSIIKKENSLNLLWEKMPENAQVERFSL